MTDELKKSLLQPVDNSLEFAPQFSALPATDGLPDANTDNAACVANICDRLLALPDDLQQLFLAAFFVSPESATQPIYRGKP